MKHLIFPLSFVFLCSFFMNGCDTAQPNKKGGGEQPVVQNDPPPVEVPANPPEQPQNAEEKTVTVAATPQTVATRGNYASAGDTSNPMSIITTPISVMFRTQDRIVLQQVEAGMNYFKAEHGRIPATEAEFMEKIIKANNIQLPPLPAGQKYVYEGGELKVQRPAP